MIQSLIQYVPPLDQLKQELERNPNLIEKYLGAELIKGDIDSVEYIIELKQQLDSINDKSN